MSARVTRLVRSCGSIVSRPRGLSVSIALCTIGFGSAAFGQSVVCVDDNAPAGGDGTCWSAPYRFLQDALAAASSDGQITEIRVAQGTYLPDRDELNPDGTGDRTLSFDLVTGVTLKGGYAGIGETDPDAWDVELFETVLTGDLIGENSHHVVTATGTGPDTILVGVEISGGRAPSGSSDGGADSADGEGGGGILVSSAILRVHNCRVVDNSSGGGGSFLKGGEYSGGDGGNGGAILALSSQLYIRDCEIVGNWTGNGSGGDFSAGRGGRGGGLFADTSEVRIENTRIADNHTGYGGSADAGGGKSGGDGGGVSVSGGFLSLIHCTIDGNWAGDGGFGGCKDFCEGAAGGDGGGLFVGSDATIDIVSTILTGNATGHGYPWEYTSDGRGGGIRLYSDVSATLTNTVIVGNTANDYGRGGGVSGPTWSANTTATLRDCTIFGNTAEPNSSGAGIHGGQLSVFNSIFWGNGSEETQGVQIDAWDDLSIQYSCVQGWTGSWGGQGNIGDDPLFENPEGPDGEVGTEDDDLRLSPASPCIDAADTSAIPADVADLDGDGDVEEAIPFDLDGLPRLIEDPETPDTGTGGCPVVDMGAYEFQDGPAHCGISLISSDPPNDAIDARQPSDPDGGNPAGWDSIELTFDGAAAGLTPDDFTVSTNPPVAAPAIVEIVVDGATATLLFDDFIPLEAWTTVTHNDSGAAVRIGYLPADVNNDKLSNASDVLTLIDNLNGVVGPFPPYQTDADRSGATNANDVLRVIDLLNGAGSYPEFLGATLPD